MIVNLAVDYRHDMRYSVEALLIDFHAARFKGASTEKNQCLQQPSDWFTPTDPPNR